MERGCPEGHKATLRPFAARGFAAAACPVCRGLWFEAGELSKAIRAHDPAAEVPPRLADAAGEPLAASGHRCPGCSVPLGLHRISAINPHMVEICPSCSGVWLPQGDLARAQAGHQVENARRMMDTPTTWGNWFFQFISGLPVEFNLQARMPPVVTYTLIFLNGAMFYAMSYWSPFAAWAIETLALFPDRIGEPGWFASLVASAFLHAGLVHLAGNMYFLWLLGDNVEDVLGRLHFALFYVLAAIAGAVLFSIENLDTGAPTLGASGAISGLLALYAVVFRRSRLTFMLVIWQVRLSAPWFVGIWLLFNLGGWYVGSRGVAWSSHLGGFLFGVIYGLATRRHFLRNRPLLQLLHG